MRAWCCEEALLRAPCIPELWCEMRREKAYRRGSSATNHPFHRDGHGVHPWTPAHCRAFRSLSCHFTDLRTAAWILLPWVLRSPDCGLPALRLTHLCISVHLAAQCHTHTHTRTTGVFKTIWRVTQQSASRVQVRASFTLRWPMLHSFAHSLQTWLSQLHQIVWDFISWKSDNFCPVSVHYYLEIPFTC